MVYCRDGCGNEICYACTTLLATGGFCKDCLEKFTSIHGKNHQDEARNDAYTKWLFGYQYEKNKPPPSTDELIHKGMAEVYKILGKKLAEKKG